MPDPTVGLVLAAGAGSRFGMPKALAVGEDGVSWLKHATDALREGGCSEVLVVLGASSEAAAGLLPVGVQAVVATNWAQGQAASLRAGLEACAKRDAGAVAVTLVDLPYLRADAVRRVCDDPDPKSLRRAMYDGVPGHPVLIGRDHWADLVEQLSGDSGAAEYLAAHGVRRIDCTDLGGGHDVDEAEQ